ncbi:DNA-directed RNA polymerases II, IV and V subunit 9B-like isoform X2 [Ananas comosus]|uniref:DNA-directed RNA polymerases II, IV and V subunit 9B-like isoform X2 n=1 Tax=Ananas comosus TaxID=4615 RepID=A0A6P5FKP3_ANACO|nr:DNA-directed RNA polymerases II, IV and V subunit 9B-like isoform X2 [Ananas comosus]
MLAAIAIIRFCTFPYFRLDFKPGYVEVAENNCVYRNVVDHSVDEFTQVLEDVASDPTLPRTKSVRCATCGHGEAVFFQATTRSEDGMTLFFVCCNPSCGNRWRD